ncbi:hypothetical protein [Yeosuana marina]|nr:hypothetical protein [Yeosuana marina]
MAIPKSSSKPTIERFVAEHEAKLIWHKTFINSKNLEYNTPVNTLSKLN